MKFKQELHIEITGKSSNLMDYSVKFNGVEVGFKVNKLELLMDADKGVPTLSICMIPDNIHVIAKIPNMGQIPNLKSYYTQLENKSALIKKGVISDQ